MMAEQRVIGRRVIRLASTGSTMDDVAALAARGEPEGTVVVAAEQTAGRGRAGRSWVAPAGTCVLCSVLLRPPVEAPRLGVLPLVAGVAVAMALDRLSGTEMRLKWPNDVWLDERKVAGLLMVAKTAGNRIESVVLGIGINVDVPAGELPPGATSLLTETGRRFPLNDALSAVLAALDDTYTTYLASGGQPSLAAWRQRAALLGERVSVRDGDRALTGWMRGVGDRGELLLELDSGELRSIVAGELTRGPTRA